MNMINATLTTLDGKEGDLYINSNGSCVIWHNGEYMKAIYTWSLKNGKKIQYYHVPKINENFYNHYNSKLMKG